MPSVSTLKTVGYVLAALAIVYRIEPAKKALMGETSFFS